MPKLVVTKPHPAEVVIVQVSVPTVVEVTPQQAPVTQGLVAQVVPTPAKVVGKRKYRNFPMPEQR